MMNEAEAATSQEYWNDDGTEDISASSFEVGQNVLAVYGRDTGRRMAE